MVQERFGPPETLRLTDEPVPVIGPHQVLVQVRAAGLNPYDWHSLRGDPKVARLMGGLGRTRPAARVAGLDAAGRVEAVGQDVDGLSPGDEVMGFVQGALAEFACAAAEHLVLKPQRLSFEEAAALPLGAVTALRGLREVAGLTAGQRVLVNGAAGGVGTMAVQIAAADGAEVTGVCSTRNVELVRSLGATHVVDHTRESVDDAPDRFDAVLDNQGNLSLRRLRALTTPDVTIVLNGGGSPGTVVGPVATMLRGAVLDRFVGQRIRFLPTRLDHAELVTVAALVAAGSLRPVVDRTVPLADTAAALRYLEQGHVRGKVVVTVV